MVEFDGWFNRSPLIFHTRLHTDIYMYIYIHLYFVHIIEQFDEYTRLCTSVVLLLICFDDIQAQRLAWIIDQPVCFWRNIDFSFRFHFTLVFITNNNTTNSHKNFVYLFNSIFSHSNVMNDDEHHAFSTVW